MTSRGAKGLDDASGGLFAAVATDEQSTPTKAGHLGHRARLRERFHKEPENVPDYELLEMLLAMAQPRLDTKPLAKDLLKTFNNSFADVISADAAALQKVDGMGPAGVAALKVVQEAALRLLRPKMKTTDAISSWSALLDYLTAKTAYGDIEQFRVIYLDRKNKILADVEQQRGTVDHTPVYPREVVKQALDLNASAFIMVHDKPSVAAA